MGMRAVELSSSGKEAGTSRPVVDTSGVAVGFADVVVVDGFSDVEVVVIVAVVVNVEVVGCVVLVAGAVVVGPAEQAARPMQQNRTTKMLRNGMNEYLYILTPHSG